MEYYLAIADGERAGPLSTDQVRSLWNSGQITVNTLAWSEGMEDWRPVGTIESITRASANPSRSAKPLTETLSSYADIPCTAMSQSEIKPREPETEEIHYTTIAAPSLLEGASSTSTSQIVMGIENMRKEEYEKALNLFTASLEETHTVAAGWLGVAYAESYLVSIDRKTLENIRHAVDKAHRYCPTKQQRISDHHGVMLCYALGQSAVLAGLLYQENLTGIVAAQDHLESQRKAANDRAASVLVGTVAGVLGSRAKSSVGSMVGYGIAANHVFKATDAHEATNLRRAQVSDSLRSSRTAGELATAFVLLGYKISEELEQVSSSCSLAVRNLIADTVKQNVNALYDLQTGAAKAKETLRVKPRRSQSRFQTYSALPAPVRFLIALVTLLALPFIFIISVLLVSRFLSAILELFSQ